MKSKKKFIKIIKVWMDDNIIEDLYEFIIDGLLQHKLNHTQSPYTITITPGHKGRNQ